MLEYLRNIFKKEDTKPLVINDDNLDIRFELSLENLKIGYLWVEESLWKFKYAEEFKQQNTYSKIAGFSNLDKIYSNGVLWPFFKIRIPGLKQPMIKEILKEENIKDDNEIVLLKRFGRESISNPYILTPQE